jgi:hypothetical protein
MAGSRNVREEKQLPVHSKIDVHAVRRKLAMHGGKGGTMAKKKSGGSLGAVDLSKLYLPKSVHEGYWFHLRDEMYSSLRGRSIPEDLIADAAGFAQHSEVRWSVPPEPGKSVQEGHYEIYELIGPDSEQGEQSVRDASTLKPPKTVGEALAFFLSIELRALKGAQAAPVRVGGRLPRSTIAFIAQDLLQNYTVSPPGPYLQELIFDLLNIPRPSAEEVEQYAARERAVYIVAQMPKLSSEIIAKQVGVDRTSLSRWKNEKRFQERVSQIREWLKSRGVNQ